MQVFEKAVAQGKKLNLARGIPSTKDLDLITPYTIQAFQELAEQGFRFEGTDLRNYGGESFGLPPLRKVFAEILGSAVENTAVFNNASLELMANVIQWAFFSPLPAAAKAGAPAWEKGRSKIILINPSYDRHRRIAESYGLQVCQVEMTPTGPDVEQFRSLVEGDGDVVATLMVPMHSNPCGTTYSDDTVRKLCQVTPKNPGFLFLVDNAYAVHHFDWDNPPEQLSFLKAAEEAGNGNSVFIFSSTSKITWAGSGLGAIAGGPELMKWYRQCAETDSIGPNKVWHAVVARALELYPGGLYGLMKDHAAYIIPKFEAVYQALESELKGKTTTDGSTPLATWNTPTGGYFIMVRVQPGLASRVIEKCKEAGLTLTAAGACAPLASLDKNTDIRLAPTPMSSPEEAHEAATLFAVVIKMVSAEAGCFTA